MDIQDRIILLKSVPTENPPDGYIFQYVDPSDGTLKQMDDAGDVDRYAKQESGIFTPTVFGNSSSGSYSGTFNGHYIKTGDLIFINLSVSNITADTAGSGFFHIGGLPFDPNDYIQHTQIGKYDNLTLPSGTVDVVGQFRVGAEIRLRVTKDNGASEDIDISAIDSGNTTIQMNSFYRIDS